MNSIHNYKKRGSYKVLLGLVVLILALLFFWVYYSGFFLDSSITGKVNLEVDSLVEGENLEGSLNLLLNKKELLPADSEVEISLGTQKKTFLLKDLVSSGNLVSGDFYVSGKNISGSGLGYKPVTKTVYPDVYFTYELTEVKEENTTEKTINETTNDTIEEETNETITEENTSESITEENTTTTETTTEEENTTSSSEEEPVEETTNETSSSGITGQVVSLMSAFLHSEKEGIVSKENDFVLNFGEGNFSFVSGSAYSDYEDLNDSVLDIEKTSSKAIIATNYSYEIVESDDLLSISLNDLNISPESGDLVVSLKYNDEEIGSSSKSISLDSSPSLEDNKTVNEQL